MFMDIWWHISCATFCKWRFKINFKNTYTRILYTFSSHIFVELKFQKQIFIRILLLTEGYFIIENNKKDIAMYECL